MRVMRPRHVVEAIATMKALIVLTEDDETRREADRYAAAIYSMYRRVAGARPDTAGDYALIVLAEAKTWGKRGLRSEEIAAKARALGWETKTSTPGKVMTVSLTRLRNDGLVEHRRPLWGIV